MSHEQAYRWNDRYPPSGASVGLLLFVFALGAAMLVGGLGNLTELRQQHHSPDLLMTVTHCETTRRTQHATTDCVGIGRPGSSGVTTGTWRYDDTPDEYAIGAVVTVRCTPDGTCNRPTVGRHILALLLPLAGAALAGIGLSGACNQLVELLAPGRRLPQPLDGFLHRPGVVAVVALVLSLIGSLVYMLT
ncbi:hypothetical protein ACIQF6_33305 [Kitasatospora sp. NPDC092948]|uniref:hypothetical protein n=1 Tax=Kitasatospora sp. NPDC092948 TaxID=3364088 RepID=UPI0038066F34